MAGGAGTAPVSPLCFGIGPLSPFGAAEAQYDGFGTPSAHQPCCSPFGSAGTTPPLSPFASSADKVFEPQQLQGAATAPAGGFAPQPSLFDSSVSQAPDLGLLLWGSSMLAPASMPLQQQQEGHFLQASMPAQPPVSGSLQMQAADSLSNALLLSQLHRQAGPSLAPAASCSDSIGLGFEVPAMGLGGLGAPAALPQDMLQLQLAGMLLSASTAPAAASLDVPYCSTAAAQGEGWDSVSAALDAALDAQIQALLLARNEAAMRRCVTAAQGSCAPGVLPVSAVAGSCGLF